MGYQKKLELKKMKLADLNVAEMMIQKGGDDTVYTNIYTECYPTCGCTLPIDQCDTPTIRDFTCLIDGGCDSGRCSEDGCNETRAFSRCEYCRPHYQIP